MGTVLTQATPSQPVQQQGPSKAAQITDIILHDLLLFGSLAASIWVKNPQHRVVAGQAISAVNQVLPVLDSQLGVITPTGPQS